MWPSTWKKLSDQRKRELSAWTHAERLPQPLDFNCDLAFAVGGCCVWCGAEMDLCDRFCSVRCVVAHVANERDLGGEVAADDVLLPGTRMTREPQRRRLQASAYSTSGNHSEREHDWCVRQLKTVCDVFEVIA